MILSLVLARNPRLKTILHGEKKEFVTGMLRAEEQVLVIFICGYTISVGVFFLFSFLAMPCSMPDLPQPGIKPMPPTLGMWSLNH